MIIHADLDTATVTLVDPGDFRGFHVAIAGGDTDDERLASVLAPHGRLDGEHAWITTDAVIAWPEKPPTTSGRPGSTA